MLRTHRFRNRTLPIPRWLEPTSHVQCIQADWKLKRPRCWLSLETCGNSLQSWNRLKTQQKMLPSIEYMLWRVFTHDIDVCKREIAVEAAEIGVLATEKATNSPKQICLGGLGLGTKNRAGLFGRCLGKFQVHHRWFLAQNPNTSPCPTGSNTRVYPRENGGRSASLLVSLQVQSTSAFCLLICAIRLRTSCSAGRVSVSKTAHRRDLCRGKFRGSMEKAVFDFRISDLILKVLKPHRESAVGGLGAVGIPLMALFVFSLLASLVCR